MMGLEEVKEEKNEGIEEHRLGYVLYDRIEE